MARWVSLAIMILLVVGISYADISSDGDQNSSGYWHKKAYDLQKAQKYEEALTAINQAIELTTTNTYIWNTKGSILDKLKRYEEALQAVDQTLKLDPYNTMALKIKGSILEKTNLTDESVETDLVQQANILQNTKKPDEALKVINQAIEQDPTNTEAWNTKATILLKFGNREGAIKALNETVKLNPDDVFAWHTMGITYSKMNKYEDAISAYDQEIRLNPDSAGNLLNNKAYALQALGRYDEALAVVNQALEADPNNGYAQGTKKSILSHLS
jgi:tetratricopeptide (TPR) repeat protein